MTRVRATTSVRGPLAALLAAVVMLLAACERKSAGAAHAGPRIASLSPAVGVILADLHYDQYCVGRDGHDMALSPALPVIGDQNRIDYEALIAARPTLVFTQWGSRELPARLSQLADSNHWRVLDSRLLTLEDIRETTEQVDKDVCAATNSAAPSAACRNLLARLDAAIAPKDPHAFAGVGKVLLLAEPSPPAAFGPGSCHYQLLERLGARPAIMSGAAYINLDLEDLLRMAPDAIILVKPRGPNTPAPTVEDAKKTSDQLFAAIAALDIPAAKNHRLAHIDDPLGFVPSTSMIRLADELREVLGAWAKKK